MIELFVLGGDVVCYCHNVFLVSVGVLIGYWQLTYIKRLVPFFTLPEVICLQ